MRTITYIVELIPGTLGHVAGASLGIIGSSLGAALSKAGSGFDRVEDLRDQQ